MYGNAEIEKDMLKRIVALLFALAALADRAAAASRTVRCEVLSILRRAEAVARLSVIGTAHGLGAPPPRACPEHRAAMGAAPFACNGGEPADAARLALRLRALAFALSSLAALAAGLARYAVAGAVARVRPPGPARSAGRLLQAAAVVQAPDTS